jgi:hypothetical protein
MIKPPINVLELPMAERALIAFRVAVREVLEERAREGALVSIERDGQVVEIPAREALASFDSETSK